MAIKDKLDAAWTDNLMQDATFEFRAAAQNGYWQLQEVVAKFNEILAKPIFAGVDAELKAEGQAIRTIFNSAKAALDSHLAFLEWKQV
jgi:hypothetical protein